MSPQAQPIRFNRMHHYSNPNIGNGTRFNQVILHNKMYFTFGVYTIYQQGLPASYNSTIAAKTDSMGNISNWFPYIDTAYNFGLSGWSSDIKTSDGGYIVSGRAFKRTNSTYNGFLMKIDSNLNIQWKRFYSDTAANSTWLYRDYAFQSLKITPDNGYIAVGIRYKSGGTSCGLAVKFDSLGNEQWVRTYNLNYYMSDIHTVAIVPDGYILGGRVKYTSAFGNIDDFITKVDTSGNVVWQKIFGGIKSDGYLTLQNHPDGSIMAIYTKSDSSLIDNAGDYHGFGNWQFYKISAITGDTLWSLSYGPQQHENVCYSFRVFPDGSALAAGTYGYFNYPWLLHLNSEGILDWYKEYSLMKPNNSNFYRGVFYDLQQTEDKGFVVCGEIRNSDSTNGNCGWILKIDAQGNWQDTATYIQPGVKLQSSIALYPNPVSSQLTVSYFQEMEEAILEIYNTLGVKQMEIKLPQGQNSYSFSVSHLAKGYYKAIIKEKGNIRGQQGLVITE